MDRDRDRDMAYVSPEGKRGNADYSHGSAMNHSVPVVTDERPKYTAPPIKPPIKPPSKQKGLMLVLEGPTSDGNFVESNLGKKVKGAPKPVNTVNKMTEMTTSAEYDAEKKQFLRRRGAGARAEPAVLALELIFQIAQLYELRLTGLPAGRLHSRNRV